MHTMFYVSRKLNMLRVTYDRSKSAIMANNVFLITIYILSCQVCNRCIDILLFSCFIIIIIIIIIFVFFDDIMLTEMNVVHICFCRIKCCLVLS